MTGYLVLLLAGVVLIVIGIIVLVFLPQRQGGTVKLFTVEVTAPGAGFGLIVVGLAAMGLAAPQVTQIGFVSSPTQTPVAIATIPPTVLVTEVPGPTPTGIVTPTPVSVTCAPNVATDHLPLMDGPGTSFKELRQINEGETVQVLAWSYTADGSAVASHWFWVRTSEGHEGWMQSREYATPAGSGYVYPSCKVIDPENQDPLTYPLPLRAP